jgi:hypothetical protein
MCSLSMAGGQLVTFNGLYFGNSIPLTEGQTAAIRSCGLLIIYLQCGTARFRGRACSRASSRR